MEKGFWSQQVYSDILNMGGANGLDGLENTVPPANLMDEELTPLGDWRPELDSTCRVCSSLTTAHERSRMGAASERSEG